MSPRSRRRRRRIRLGRQTLTRAGVAAPTLLSATRRQRREHRPPAKPQGRHAAAAPARTAAILDARRRHPQNARSTRHGLPRPGPFDIAGERRGPQRRRPHRRPYARDGRSNGCAPTPADWRAAGRSRGRRRQECAVGAGPIRGSPAIPVWRRSAPCHSARQTSLCLRPRDADAFSFDSPTFETNVRSN